jgi:hypothetical protein
MSKLSVICFGAAIAASTSVAAAPTERRLHSSSLEASTYLWNDWNKFQENYHPNYVADDDPKTAWVEGDKGSGAGQWLRIHITPLDKTTKIRLRIRNGYQKSKNLFAANARAKAITIKLVPSNIEKTVTLADKDGWQDIEVEQKAGPTKAIELQVGSVYEGTKYADLCISDVQVYATSETPDNPAFEKSKRKELMDWRKGRLASAKLFGKKKVELPLLPGYVVTKTDHKFDGNGIGDMVAAAQKDPKFDEWKAALATARTLVGELDSLPQAQIAPTTKQTLPVVDGLELVDIEDKLFGNYSEDALRLPNLGGAVAVLFADQLRVLDVKTKLTMKEFQNVGAMVEDPSASAKCKAKTAFWVKRGKAENGRDTVQAIAIGECGRLAEREGYTYAASVSIAVYGADGKLALTVGDNHIDAYRWATEGGKPMIVGGRGLLYGTAIDIAKK